LFLGLQFFIAGLHTYISLMVIKSCTADKYEVFMIALAYETGLKSKKERDTTLLKVNEMDAEYKDKDKRAEIEAIRRKYQQKKMFCSNNGSAYQQHSNGGNGSNFGNGSNGSNGNNHKGRNQ